MPTIYNTLLLCEKEAHALNPAEQNSGFEIHKLRERFYLDFFEICSYNERSDIIRSNILGMNSKGETRTVLSHVNPPFAVKFNRVVDALDSFLDSQQVKLETLKKIANSFKSLPESSNITNLERTIYYAISTKLGLDGTKLKRIKTNVKETKSSSDDQTLVILSPKTLETILNKYEETIKSTQLDDDSFIRNYLITSKFYFDLLICYDDLFNKLKSSSGITGDLKTFFSQISMEDLTKTYETNQNCYGYSYNTIRNIYLKLFEIVKHDDQILYNFIKDYHNIKQHNDDIVEIVNNWNVSLDLSIETLKARQNQFDKLFDFRMRRNIISILDQPKYNNLSLDARKTLETCLSVFLTQASEASKKPSVFFDKETIARLNECLSINGDSLVPALESTRHSNNTDSRINLSRSIFGSELQPQIQNNSWRERLNSTRSQIVQFQR